MGESQLIRILGTAGMPVNPTNLEKFADRLAERKHLTFNLKDNGLSRTDLTYYFRKEASRAGLFIAYSLICHSGNDFRDINAATAEFERQMQTEEFEEQMNFKDDAKKGIAIIRNPYYHKDGEYAVVKGSEALGKYRIEQVEEMFESL